MEAKSHLIVVAEKEAFKVRAMAMPDDEDEPPSPTPAPAPRRAAPAEAVPPPAAAAAAAAEAPAASSTFSKYDLNGDGVLDKDEINAMMASLGYQTGARTNNPPT